MLFNSLEYVLFLAICFTAFWTVYRLRALRIGLLLVASYVFYMAWNAEFLVLIVASTVMDYAVALGIHRSKNVATRKLLLCVSLIGNLGLLGLFKYADFGVLAVSDTLSALGIAHQPHFLRLVLPVGISFYTFQTLSYTIDVYRGELQPTKSLLDFATYVAFFPQLVAGPIVRAGELLPQLAQPPSLDEQRASEALSLILKGMIKKIVVADFLASSFIDPIYDAPSAFSSSEILFSTIAYSCQIYADFSGYTDIARGSAKMFGLELPINFRRPYTATGPIEFWRNWHMTLSSWVRDYVYIPMGGSRHSKMRTYANLFFSFMIVGVWHGAGWTFVLFGLFHAITVTLNRVYRDLRGARRRRLVGGQRIGLGFVHFLFFSLHWPLFRSPNLATMREIYLQIWQGPWLPLRVPAGVAVVVGVFLLIHFSSPRLPATMATTIARMPAPAQAAITVGVAAVLMTVAHQHAAPFIYFQF